jgi:hypothetical protein
MFVRWKRRQSRPGYRAKVAVLVQSVRTAKGPRLKHICYLGSVEEGQERDQWNRRGFWYGVEPNLDKAGITGEDRARILATLEAVVPRPEPEPERPPYDLEAARRKGAAINPYIAQTLRSQGLLH